MYLQRIIITNFKNIASADLQFSPRINCICGNNGEGKTNLLDAVHYLSMTKSFLLPTDKFTYKHGTAQAALHGVYNNSDIVEKIAISVAAGGEKVVKRNDKIYSRISEHIGLFPVVVISPSDTSLIHDSGEERRRFMNMILSQIDREYLRLIQGYNRVLAQRNKLLKSDNISSILLDTFSEQISLSAHYIYEKRKSLIDSLQQKAVEYYRALSGERESIDMEYISDLSKCEMQELLNRSYERDCFLKYTSVGVQRDDVLFTMNGYPMRKCASQGQQKSFLIALKLAQFSMMRELFGYAPILILDDVFDKLDMKRVEYLIGMVASSDFGQIFITDSSKVRLSSIMNSIEVVNNFYYVENGNITMDNGKTGS